MDGAGLQALVRALGPEARLHAVGGWVRDRLLDRAPGDLDLATALPPEVVLARARSAGLKALPTGLAHGTVTVLLEGRPVEVTTFRGDGPYGDGRRPDSVVFGVGLEEDLARRDFTINALALPVASLAAPDWRGALVDPWGGREDLARGLIRAVGDPLRRFAEDGLRPLRACRFASQLGFVVDQETLAAIPLRLEVAGRVAVERAFTELTKLLLGREPARGLALLASTGLLDLWLPELRPMVGCAQNRHHRLDVWAHTLLACERIPAGDDGFAWALLLHDAGKPAARTNGPDGEAHFHGHEPVSVALAEAVLARLKAPGRVRTRVAALVALHGLRPQSGQGPAAWRRLRRRLAEAGLTVEDWIAFVRADRWGKGWQEAGRDGLDGGAWWAAEEAGLASIQAALEAASYHGMTARELALDGSALMALAGRPGGPWLGALQRHLLEAVLEDPDRNAPAPLEALVRSWLAAPGPEGVQ